MAEDYVNLALRGVTEGSEVRKAIPRVEDIVHRE
jgi:hypothetical protein